MEKSSAYERGYVSGKWEWQYSIHVVMRLVTSQQKHA